MTQDRQQTLLVAVGTRDGRVLNEGHFGDSSIFLIYEIRDGQARFIEDRSNIPYEEQGHGDPGKARVMAGLLSDVDVLVARRFGPNVKRMLHRFVCVRTRVETAQEAMQLVTASVPLLWDALESGESRDLVVLSPPSEA